MNDLELDVEILLTEANFDSHLEKGTIEMNNEYFNLLQEKMARLINENQELKKQLEEHIKAEMKMENELEEQKKEYQETYKDVREEIKEYKNQQKAFIECLEKEIVDSKAGSGQQYFAQQHLRLYKEIIGCSKWELIIMQLKRNQAYIIAKYIWANQVLAGYSYLEIMKNFIHTHNLKNG